LKRRSTKHKIDQSPSVPVALVFGAVALAVGIMVLVFNRPQAKNSLERVSSNRTDSISEIVEASYNDLLRRIAPTNVYPGIVPVHIFRKQDGVMRFHCSGGLLEDGTILTCAHSFWNVQGKNRKPWEYHFRVLQPVPGKLQPINRLLPVDISLIEASPATHDFIKCSPGLSKIIDPLEPVETVIQGGNLRFDYYHPIQGMIGVKSIVTGESAHIIGRIKHTGGPEFYILDYDSFQGESGTPFVDPVDRKVYIVSRSMKLGGVERQVFKLSPLFTGVSFCSAVRLR